MIDAALETQKAYYQRLNGLVEDVEVYDNVPENAATEYIVISSDTAIDWSTKTEYGQEITQEIQVVTHEDGAKVLCKQIEGEVIKSIRGNPLDIDGYNNMVTTLDMRQTFVGEYTETGQITRGVIRFRHKLEQL